MIITLAFNAKGTFEQQGGYTSLMMHGLLLHNLARAYAGTFNMAHWSVAVEWQLYFFLPLVLLPIWRRFGNAAMLLVAATLAAMPLVILPKGSDLAWSCPWYLLLFAVGVAGATANSAGFISFEPCCLAA